MMLVLFVSYLAFGTVLFIRNGAKRNMLWFLAMFAGFSLALLGLAFYTEYLSSGMHTRSQLFGDIAPLLWRLNYYLRLDIYDTYRLLNVGVALYVCGSVCYPLTLLNAPYRRFLMPAVLLSMLLMVIILDPNMLILIYGVRDSALFNYILDARTQMMERVLSDFFNLLIKLFVIASLGLWVAGYRLTAPVMRRRLLYNLMGIFPVSLLFAMLFYWYPSNRINVMRYQASRSLSLPYSDWLYTAISVVAFLFALLLLYTGYKYNATELNVKKSKLEFNSRLSVANMGARVFSHSIKNEFVAIKLLSDQLQKSLQIENADPQSVQSAALIGQISASSIDKLGRLTRRLSDVHLEYAYVDAVQTVREAALRIQERSGVPIAVDASAPLVLYVDKRQFEQVLENLLINSLEACEETKKPEIRVLVGKWQDYGHIIVADNGKGIEKKNLKKIFEPFYSSKTTLVNWGIGLAFCQAVITAFGGAVTVDSSPGEKTQFHIYIPLSEVK